MIKLEQLQEKLTKDYQEYREKALLEDKETLFNNSYYNAICGEWECYLDGWFGYDNGEEEADESVIDALLGTENIFEQLVDYVSDYDTIDLNPDAFHTYLEEFTESFGK